VKYLSLDLMRDLFSISLVTSFSEFIIVSKIILFLTKSANLSSSIAPILIKAEIESVQLQIDQAKRSLALNKAAELEFGTLNSLQKKLKEKSESLVNSQKNGDASLLRQEVTFDDIAEVVSKWTSIPVQNLNQSEKDKL